MEYYLEIINKQIESVSWPMLIFSAIISAEMVYLLFMLKKNLMHRESPKSRVYGYMFIAAYLCFVYHTAYYNREAGSRDEVILFFKSLQENASPTAIRYFVLNVLFFVPIGIGICLIRNKDNFWVEILAYVIYGLTGSSIIEVAQMVTKRGYFEMDDLLANTLGATIGGVFTYLIWRTLKDLEKKKQ